MSTGTAPEVDRGECTPCRGTGQLISGKGGTPHTITCPWCGGDGQFHAGWDAQEHAPAGPGADARTED